MIEVHKISYTQLHIMQIDPKVDSAAQLTSLFTAVPNENKYKHYNQIKEKANKIT